jgi:hypothetical protein
MVPLGDIGQVEDDFGPFEDRLFQPRGKIGARFAPNVP